MCSSPTLRSPCLHVCALRAKWSQQRAPTVDSGIYRFVDLFPNKRLLYTRPHASCTAVQRSSLRSPTVHASTTTNESPHLVAKKRRTRLQGEALWECGGRWVRPKRLKDAATDVVQATAYCGEGRENKAFLVAQDQSTTLALAAGYRATGCSNEQPDARECELASCFPKRLSIAHAI